MFKIDDYVMHNLYGVLQVNGFEDMEFDGIKNTYYVCHALYGSNKGTTIKIPINKSQFLSPIISKQKANELIDCLPSIDPLWIPESKKRIQKYEEILISNDLKQICAALKACYKSKEELKLTSRDKDFMESAEKIVYGELAISLNLPYEEIPSYIESRVKC